MVGAGTANEVGADQLKDGLEMEAPEEFVATPSDGFADQAGQQVEAIVQAAEEWVAELKARVRREAQAEADRILAEAHAAAAALREQTIADLHSEVERMCALIGEDLLASARGVIDAAASGAAGSAPRKPHPAP